MAVVTLAPGAATNSTGSGDQPWINASNVLANDLAYAVSSLGAGEVTDGLLVNDFGFSIPSGATIAGIVLRVYRDSLGDTTDYAIRVLDGDGLVAGSDKASGSTWPGSFAAASYGSDVDDWSASLTDADINDADFGFVIQSQSASGSSPRIQYVEADIYYSGGAAGDVAAVIVQSARGVVRQRFRHQQPLTLAVLSDLAEVTEPASPSIPAIVAHAGRFATARQRQRQDQFQKLRRFTEFRPGIDAPGTGAEFIPASLFIRSRPSPVLRRRPVIVAPWPPAEGNGDVCACPFGAVVVSVRFATARVVSIEADPLVPSVDGSETTRPPLTPDASATAAVIQSNFATAQIVAVCHCD
jgi:hypothetical protein